MRPHFRPCPMTRTQLTPLTPSPAPDSRPCRRPSLRPCLLLRPRTQPGPHLNLRPNFRPAIRSVPRPRMQPHYRRSCQPNLWQPCPDPQPPFSPFFSSLYVHTFAISAAPAALDTACRQGFPPAVESATDLTCRPGTTSCRPHALGRRNAARPRGSSTWPPRPRTMHSSVVDLSCGHVSALGRIFSRHSRPLTQRATKASSQPVVGSTSGLIC